MIKSREDYIFYLESDRIALGRPSKKSFKLRLKSLLIRDDIWNFQKLLRKVEYVKNCKKGIIFKLYYVLLVVKFSRMSRLLGFSISVNCFGPGLSIAHIGTIIVNSGAEIGENCRINCDVNIGTKAGYADRAPILGNNIYIAPGVKMYGDIEIADNVAIGANSVVNRSFLQSNIAIAGVPAKIINSEIDILKFLIPGTMIKLDSEQKEYPGSPAAVQYEKRV